jgi:glycosyltransferase involved in cell wall biosynthesis
MENGTADVTGINKRVLLIFPCYNEKENIFNLLASAKRLTIRGYDIVCLPVNDCSKDATLAEIKRSGVTYLNLVNNLGIGGAVQAGIKFAKAMNFDFAIQVDGDGQHPIDQIEKLVFEIEKSGCDVCIGSRYLQQEGFQSTMSRRFGIKIINLLIKFITGKKIHDSTSGFRIFNKKAIDLFSHYYPDKYPEPEAIVYGLINGLRIGETAVIMKERQGGKSSIGGLMSGYYMVKVSLAIVFLKLSNLFSKR